MALLLFLNPLPSLSSSSSSSLASSTLSATASPVTRLHFDALNSRASPSYGIQTYTTLVAKRGSVVVKASSDIEGTASTEGGESSSDDNKEVVRVDKLPLESKLQERMEQKMRMKLARKIRLRRKRLVRKRRMRKKGRWPPSKMKKLKNV